MSVKVLVSPVKLAEIDINLFCGIVLVKQLLEVQKMNWIYAAIVGMLVMASYSMFVPFMLKNYQIPGATTATLWLIGSAAGLALVSKSISVSSETPWAQWAIILLMGFVFGSLMNFCITYSFINAPNPAYTMSILNLSASVALICSPLLYFYFGNLFAEATINIRGVTGVLIVMVGGYLVSTA